MDSLLRECSPAPAVGQAPCRRTVWGVMLPAPLCSPSWPCKGGAQGPYQKERDGHGDWREE